MKKEFSLSELPPEFQKVVDDLTRRGKPSGWVTRVVDVEDTYARFIKDGKHWFRSDCPFYEGFWLDGGIGSVQCKKAGQPIPDLFWDLFCKENCHKCPHFEKKGFDSDG